MPPKETATLFSTAAHTAFSSRTSTSSAAFAAARRLDFLRNAVNGAGELGMRIHGFRRQHDIRAIARAPERNLAANATTRAGDE